ncbi:MAG: DNA-binding protein WhiA [Eubacterium sp.]|nr:DNA-binding protein WhiA [Eubacterium sp.]
MSFAGEVRKELSQCMGKASHCAVAELRAIYEGCKKNVPAAVSANDEFIFIFSESLTIRTKCITLAKKAFRQNASEKNVNGANCVQIPYEKQIADALENREEYKKQCCKKAYLRGWFLIAGTVSDPEGQYDLEIVFTEKEKAENIAVLLKEYDIDPGISRRKDNYVLYIKEGQKVVDFLGLVGAHASLMKFENARIVKEVRGRINRRVNCETANINKTVSASAKQIKDIEYLKEEQILKTLPEGLQKIAEVRLENPDVSLAELGEMLDPPVGKSGVNHRLRKLCEIAARKREEGGKKC